jgi:hypothetical protein
MPEQDEELVAPVADTAAVEQLIARVGKFSDFRPDPPRDFHGFPYGWLTWLAPQRDNFTHYRLRVDHDDELPDYEMPSGQTALQIFRGRTFFLTTYNQSNGYESPRQPLHYDAEADLRAAVAESLAEEEVHVNYTMTGGGLFAIPLSPYPHPGLRLVVFLAQDASGGNTPDWDTNFKNAPTTDIDGAADTLSVIEFTYRKIAGLPSGEDAWYCTNFQTGLSTL